MIIGESEEAIAETAARMGRLEPGRIAKDRADLDYIRVFVGKANVVGVPLAQLPLPTGFPIHLLHVRRYDADLVSTPDLTLEFGDRVGVLMPPDRKEEVRRYFGDTVKAAAEFSYVSLGFGMVLGVLLGLIPIPIPGVGTVTLGIGGGPLIVALILGKLRRTGPMLWTMPLPANIVLRNFGLAMFLATVGVNAGQPFVRTVAESGFTMLFIGAAVLLTTVLIVLLVGYYVLKIPYDDLVGVASGADRKPGHSCFLDADGADRTSRHRICDDFPVNDHRESHRRADRRPPRGPLSERLSYQIRRHPGGNHETSHSSP
jgi:putative transport protein